MNRSNEANLERSPVVTRPGRVLAHLVLISAIVALGIPGRGLAQTTDTALGPASLTHGEGQFTINQQNHTEFTQQSNQAVVSWGNDIHQPAEHTLEFRQDANFSVLNQSPGERASEFYGRVICDATCIFANEAGIHFGDGSYIDVGRMFAVAGSIAEGDFLSGLHHFTDINGSVINRGTMRGEHIALLGQHVANYGHVATPQGSFMMLAGNEIWLRDHDSPVLIQADLHAPTEPTAQASVENWGEIEAEGGQVRLAAGDLLSFAIRQGQEAKIRAEEITLQGGQESIVEVRGELDARGLEAGKKGGQIDVLGDYVIVGDGAVLDASGMSGGGKIHVGGAQHGDDALPAAKGTFVHENAQIRADALDKGDGGEIVVWADETAQVYGSLSAQGGFRGGSGGFVETSGKIWLDLGTSAPQLMARSGLSEDTGGTWLIDPNNISIVDRPTDAQACNPGDPGCVPCNSSDGSCLDPGLSEVQRLNPIFYDPFLWPVINAYYGAAPDGPVLLPSVNDSTIDASLITQTLSQGVNVWLFTDTAGQDQGDQDGNIRVEADIRIDDDAVDFGTQARLVLWAANDIVVNHYVGVDRGTDSEPEEPTNMTLDVDFWANSKFTIENTVSADQIPPQYLGSVEINSDIETGGGLTILNGADINLASEATIRTDGGLVSLFATEGNVQLLGGIDTSSQVVTEQEGSRPGGDFLVASEAIRRPANSLDNEPSIVVGGNVTLAGNVSTGGGVARISVAGGDIEILADITTGGGQVDLFAATKTLAPVTSEDEGNITTGGRIRVGNDADIVTGGGDFTAGFVEGQPAQATDIVIQGRIDTQAPIDASGNPQLGGAIRLAALAASEEASPGQIVIKKFEDDLESVSLVTGGSEFLALSDGDFLFEDASLDVTADPEIDPTTIDSEIQIRTDGNARIVQSDTGTTELIANQLIEIGYASSEASGDVTFEGAPQISSDQFIFQAGYGASVADGLARIDLGEADFSGAGTDSPTLFSLTQEADLDTSEIEDRIDVNGLETLIFASRGGLLTVSETDAVSGAGLDLTLVGATGIEIEEDFPGANDSSKVLSTLSIDALGELVVDATMAGRISGAAENLVITAGTPEDASDPSLVLEGGLKASDSITLHAGAEGSGDLLVVSDDGAAQLVLESSSVTLWAGNGDADGDASIQLSNVLLQKSETERISEFTLRQDAAITDETIGAKNDAVEFKEGIGGVEYTLRADAESSTEPAILIGEDGAEFLQDSRLHLYARGEIALEEGTDLTVERMDLGGINDFNYTSALNDHIVFTNDAESRLTLRAGLGGEGGVLSFESDMTLQADEIRLVAGDGAPDSSNPSARINLTPSSGAAPIFTSATEGQALTFLFRQDSDIGEEDLPDFATQFGEETLPGQIAFQSDNGRISFDSFEALPLIQAENKIILSASTVTFARLDGQDLDLENVLDVADDSSPEIEIRSDTVALTAAGTEEEGEPLVVVQPGSVVRLTGFEDQSDESETGQPPPDFDFDSAPNTAPNLITVVQNGSIAAEDLIDPDTQLGNGDPVNPVTLQNYSLTSLKGGIEITPEKVAEANLSLALVENEDSGSTTRNILFSGTDFSFASLTAITPFAWNVKSEIGDDLTLDAREVIRMQAGLSGVGDMTFGGNVTLDGSIIFLAAGDNPAERTDPDATPSTSRVLAYDVGQDFSLDLVLNQTDENDTFFSILQAGGFTNNDQPAAGDSRIPDASQFEVYNKEGELIPNLDVLSFNSTDGGIQITNLFDPSGQSTLPADELILTAGYLNSSTDQTVSLTQEDGQDFDPTSFQAFVVLASDIEFKTTGDGYVKLDDSVNDESRVLLLGPVDLDQAQSTSPKSLSIEQERAFVQTSSGCDAGCLPNPNTQFGPTGTTGITYALTSQNEILINDTIAGKTFGTDLALSGSEVTFNIDSPRDLDIFVDSLLVNADAGDGNIFFRGGEDDPLTIFSIEDQTYLGNTLLEGTTEFYGSTVEFGGTIEADDSPGTDQEDKIIVLVEDQAIFRADIGRSDGRQIDLFRVLFDPGASGGVPNAIFGSEVASESYIGADQIDFFNSSNPEATASDPIRVPTVATISKLMGNLTIDAETFNMGIGEKLSVQGDLDIKADTSVALGDLSAVNISVTSPLIELLQRPAGQFLTANNGLMPDAGVDYVANEITFQSPGSLSPNIVLSGTGLKPIFGLDNPNEIPEWMKQFSTFQIQPSAQPINGSNFILPGYNTLADLHPEGASRDDPSTLYFNQAIPPRPTAWNPSNWLPFNRTSVEELDIDPEPMTARAYKTLLAGTTLIDDVGVGFTAWDGRPLPVSEARIDGTEAAQAVALMNELFGPRGKRAERVRAILQGALNQYRRNTGAQRIVGFELRRFVKNRPSSLYEAHQMLEDLDLLFAMHRSLGLTPGEYRPIQKRWLQVIKPDGITTGELAEAIHPSQYVRGTDVLDIFGD